MDKQCSERVYPNEAWGSFHPHQCNKPAIVERDGKPYCKVHDPEYIKEKQDKATAKYEASKCKGCGFHFYGSVGITNFKYCPYCGTKRE